MSAHLKAFACGARDTLPMLLGALPFGIIFGTLAIASGLSMPATLLMSALVFAGSAQFIAVSLVASGAGLAVLLATTLIVNLRHMLYSASLLPYVRQLSPRWKVPLAFWLTDETYAVVHRHYLDADASNEHKHWYFVARNGRLGIGLCHGGDLYRHRRALVAHPPYVVVCCFCRRCGGRGEWVALQAGPYAGRIGGGYCWGVG